MINKKTAATLPKIKMIVKQHIKKTIIALFSLFSEYIIKTVFKNSFVV